MPSISKKINAFKKLIKLGKSSEIEALDKKLYITYMHDDNVFLITILYEMKRIDACWFWKDDDLKASLIHFKVKDQLYGR